MARAKSKPERETPVMRQIRAACNVIDGVRLWRNNVGVGRGLMHPGVIAYGLAEGSADLVGLADGRFCALEVKAAKGRVSPEQVAWAQCVKSLGGFCATVRSVDEALAALRRCREGASE